MTAFANTSGDIIRNAGKTTLILQVLSGVLLFVLLMLFFDIASRFRYLQDGIRENAVWSVYQLDRESRALQHGFLSFQHEGETAAVDPKPLLLRYDILYSRIDVVRSSRFGDYFATNSSITRLCNEIQALIINFEPIFDRLQAGTMLTSEEMVTVDSDLDALVSRTEELLLYTNTQISTERAHNRSMLLELEKTSAIMLVLLMASVVFLVVTLRRQLKSVRAAGLSLEAMTRELGVAYAAADAGNQAKSQFMATMGHEIRTPLNAILGMAELLQHSELPADAAASARTIRSSGEALLEVINEILDYSKIEHGKLEIEARAVDIRNLADTTVGIIRGRADDRGNTVVLDIPDQLHARYVRTDPTRLRQVLLNLLSNAVKFTNNGVVTLRLREFYRDSALMLRFEVEDTGIGIDESGIAKLFKPFSQVDASISRKYGGTGLGLTICKQIVEKLGGELGMSSTVGVGSIFWFELSVTATDKSEIRHQSSANGPQAELPRRRILLVEDNLVNQQVATRFLQRLGQEVTVASDGAEALDITASQEFDLIFMDMQMPVMDGIEATQRIIERGGPGASTPIVAMTANASDVDSRRCREAGMVGFESKPITMDRLRAVLSDYAGIVTEAAQTINPEPVAEPVPERLLLPEGIAAPGALPDSFDGGEIEGLDAARQDELVDALGEEIFAELISSFFDDAVDLVAELRGIMAGEGGDLDRVLHTIKGAAVNIGLNGIAERAHALRAGTPDREAIEGLNGEIQLMKQKLVA